MDHKRQSSPVDAHVGDKVRARRNALGMTQSHLAKELGITFQQVQKYENGSNRVGASRLWEISQALQVDISYFFEGLRKHDKVTQHPELSSREIKIVKELRNIEQDEVREKIGQFISQLARGDSRNGLVAE